MLNVYHIIYYTAKEKPTSKGRKPKKYRTPGETLYFMLLKLKNIQWYPLLLNLPELHGIDWAIWSRLQIL